MRERKIFLNISHVPKIWGVPYPKVFMTVGLLILSTVGGNALSSGAGTMVKMIVVAFSVLLAGSLHVFFLLAERRDLLDQDVNFVKDELNSQSSSLQTVRLVPGKSAQSVSGKASKGKVPKKGKKK